MSKYVREDMSLMSESNINSILKIDARALSSNPDAFVKANYVNYYLGVNTWLHIIKEFSPYGWVWVRDEILRNGLVPTIARYASAADDVVHDIPLTSTPMSLYRDVQKYCGLVRPREEGQIIGEDPMATILVILRYLKRFSPLEADKIKEKSLSDFLAVENRSRMWSRRGYSPYLTSRVREFISQHFNFEVICQEIKNLDVSDIVFTSGVAYDSRANLGSKLTSISKSRPEYFYEPFGIPCSGAYPDQEVEYWGRPEVKHLWGSADRYPYWEVRDVAVRAVPKSYKASRIIAMEDTYRQALAKAVFKVIDKHLPSGIDLHDQEKNQILAGKGSVGEPYATLDLSNASDCVTKLLFSDLFPQKFQDLILPLVGTHYTIDGKRRLMYQLSTAGNALTFVIESMVFYSIVGAAQKCQSMWTNEEYVEPRVYGDDIICDTRTSEIVVEWLEALGFIVNESKSFVTGYYRESCGKEYLNGVDLTSIYYPRFPIEGVVENKRIKLSSKTLRDSWTGEYFDSLMSAISLQHKLFYVSVPASLLLREAILETFPRMTSSIAGTVCSDLWEYEERFILGHEPYGPDGKGWRDTPDPSVTEVKLHYAPLVIYKGGKVQSGVEKWYSLHKYQKFLKSGPEWDPDFLDDLGLLISRPSLPVESITGTPEMVWKLKG